MKQKQISSTLECIFRKEFKITDDFVLETEINLEERKTKNLGGVGAV